MMQYWKQNTAALNVATEIDMLLNANCLFSLNDLCQYLDIVVCESSNAADHLSQREVGWPNGPWAIVGVMLTYPIHTHPGRDQNTEVTSGAWTPSPSASAPSVHM